MFNPSVDWSNNTINLQIQGSYMMIFYSQNSHNAKDLNSKRNRL